MHYDLQAQYLHQILIDTATYICILWPGFDFWQDHSIPFTVISGMTPEVSFINVGQTERIKLQANYQINEQITEFDGHIR
jgi:hypothetical protein